MEIPKRQFAEEALDELQTIVESFRNGEIDEYDIVEWAEATIFLWEEYEDMPEDEEELS